MTIESWIERYPAPPPVPRGKRHVVSCSFSEDEYDALQLIAHHPRTKAMYGGQLVPVIRHGLLPFLDMMLELLESGYKPTIQKIRDEIENHNLIQGEQSIIELLDRKASRCSLLLNNNQTYAALDEYDKLLDLVASLGPAWSSVVEKFMAGHSGLNKFRNKVIWGGQEELLALKNIEEKQR